MSSAEFVRLLLQLGALLGAAALLGHGAKLLRQPPIIGEMFAGVVLGVTVFGAVAPGVFAWLFTAEADVTMVREAAVKLGMLFFLFVAGSEVDLREVRTIGRQGLIIGLIGTLLPIVAGVALVYATPVSLWGEVVGIERLPFALFIGMNLANSANPVLARILMDLGLMRTRLASVLMTATVVDDLINWTLYAIILSSIASTGGGGGQSVVWDLGLVAILFVIMLVGGRRVAPHLVRFAVDRLGGAAGYVTVIAAAVMLSAAAAEAIGVHAFLGAFLAGVAISSSGAALPTEGHAAFTSITLGFFAPIFFASMALTTDFIDDFEPVLVVVLLATALISKLLSVVLGVRAAGLPADRRAWAMAWGLNARGATGIVLATTGRAAGIIDDSLFVALVVMCIVTSLLAGPMMNACLGTVGADDGPGDDGVDAAAPGTEASTPTTPRPADTAPA